MSARFIQENTTGEYLKLWVVMLLSIFRRGAYIALYTVRTLIDLRSARYYACGRTRRSSGPLIRLLKTAGAVFINPVAKLVVVVRVLVGVVEVATVVIIVGVAGFVGFQKVFYSAHN